MDARRFPYPLASLLGLATFVVFCLVSVMIAAPGPDVIPAYTDPSVGLWAYIVLNNAVILSLIWGAWRYLEWRVGAAARPWFAAACLMMLAAWAVRAGIAEAAIGGSNVGFWAIFTALAPHAIIELTLFALPAAGALRSRAPWRTWTHVALLALISAVAVIEVWVSPLTGVLS